MVGLDDLYSHTKGASSKTAVALVTAVAQVRSLAWEFAAKKSRDQAGKQVKMKIKVGSPTPNNSAEFLEDVPCIWKWLNVEGPRVNIMTDLRFLFPAEHDTLHSVSPVSILSGR